MFIVFEGIEACGKTTQIRLLMERLARQNVKAHLLREPGGTNISEQIRHILKDVAFQGVMHPETELLLMNAARAQLVREKIQPALDQKQWVICDRYYFSSLAYQGFGRGLPMDSLKAITKYAVGTTEPDAVFFLDIPLETSLQRIRTRNEELRKQGIIVRDRFEESDIAFHKRVYNGFQTLNQQLDVFHRIDGTQPPEQIEQAIWAVIREVASL